MSPLNWTPPRGAVTVTPDPARTGSYVLDCATCGYHYPTLGHSSTRTDADDQKRYHHCPIGTVGAYPTCPTCKSVGKFCRNALTLKPQTDWHDIRTRIWSDAVGEQA